MNTFRLPVFFISILTASLAFADQMVGNAYEGGVQECYTARQNIAANPTITSLHSEMTKICNEKSGLKVAYKLERLNFTNVDIITLVCYKEINSALSPLFGCRYYLTGYSLD